MTSPFQNKLKSDSFVVFMIKILGTGKHAHDKNERSVLYEDSVETKHFESNILLSKLCGAKTDSFFT